MSDLQCAVTLIVATPRDAEQSRELGESLQHRRIALVYTSDSGPAVQTAEVAADVLGVPVRAEAALDGKEQSRAELEAIADLHRGETVLVITPSGVIWTTLSSLPDSLSAAFTGSRVLSEVATAELAADADGWACMSWAGDVPR